MKKATYSVLSALLLTGLVYAQDEDAAAAQAATSGQQLLKPGDLKWNPDLQWVSFVVEEGGVQPTRGYFAALSKREFDDLIAGSATGMIRFQQVFYFNSAARLFSRFDAPQPGASISLYESDGYFRPEKIVRVVPLNKQFVENLALRKFLKVEG